MKKLQNSNNRLNWIQNKAIKIARTLYSELSIAKAILKAWDIAVMLWEAKTKVVEFKFQKADKTIRTAFFTTHPSFQAPIKGVSRKKTSNKISFFDLDKEQFRSFIPQRFIGLVSATSLKYMTYAQDNKIVAVAA